jgi:transcriptional activator of cad operon
MTSPASTHLQIGDWRVDPTTSEISRNGTTTRLETRTLRLLLALANHPGEVLSIDDLLTQAWPGVAVSPDSVYQAITSLRRLLNDDPKHPTYIVTVPRLGYRLIAPVTPVTVTPLPVTPLPDHPTNPAAAPQPPVPRPHAVRLQLALLLLCLAVAAAYLVHAHFASQHPPAPLAASPTQKSIAVLPFSDLTEGMHQGEFADGLTEELTDKLSKLPGFRVPSPTNTFYYRDKNLPVATIAANLGVAYVLDGSVRKSGDQVRVAARLVRASTGYVLWTQTYDRPFHDLVMVQDDIATQVTKALSSSTEFKSP